MIHKTTIPDPENADLGVLLCDNTALELAHQVLRLRAVLEWYGENARLARLIHSEGDKGRHALSDDGGKRAREALGQ